MPSFWFKKPDRVKVIQTLTGTACLLLGALVMAGWSFRFLPLIQLYPRFVPMHFNTAAGLFLCGAAFFCHIFDFKKAGPVITGFIFLIGAGTFLEYVFDCDLRIDELLVRYHGAYSTINPGRMAPTTALSFCLVALAFIAIRFFHAKHRYIVSGTAGAFLIGLGGISLAGYLSGASSIYIWGMFNTMALPTAIALSVVGFTFIYEAWKRGSQITPLILVGSVGLILSIQVFHVLRYQQDQNFEMDFMSKAEDRVALFRRYLEADVQMMDSLRAFFESEKDVDQDEFSMFVEKASETNHTIFAVDWVPRVPEAERPDFVARGKALHALDSFEFRERNEQGEVAVSPAREEHYPIYFSVPEGKAFSRVGFDLASDPLRKQALNKAFQTGRAAASFQVKRMDEPDKVFNLVLINPILKQNKGAGASERPQSFVVGNYNFGSIFEEIFLKIGLKGLRINVYDATEPDQEHFLYRYDSEMDTKSNALLRQEEVFASPRFTYEEAVLVADRTLKFVCVPSRDYAQPVANGLPWAASLSVAFFVLLIVKYLFLVITRDRVIQQTVRERTEELSKVNLLLREEVGQRRTAEEELRRSRSFFKTMIDNLPVAVFAKSARSETLGVFELWNKTSEEMFGLPKEKVLGKSDYDLFPKEQADFFKEKDEQVFKEDKLLDIPSEPVDTPLGRRFLHTLKVPVRDAEKKPLHLLGISQDITEKLKTELALRQSEERLREAFANSAIGKALVALDGRFIQVNPSLCSILGYSEAELLKTDFQTLTYPEDLAADLENVQKILTGKTRFYQMEKRYIRKTGEVIWCRLTVSLVRDDQGTPVHFISQIQDIHEEKNAQQELQKKSLDLARSNKELEEFAYVASHDLQEPLRKIISFSKLLEDKESGKLDEEAQDYLQRVVSGAERMRHLIEDLLTYSRVMRKQQPFVLLDLNETVKNVLSDLEIRILETEARIKTAVLPKVMADPVQIHQLFLNLMSNALKFKKKDEVPVIEITAEDLKNGLYEIRIKDNGIGFDEKYLDRIFVPFQRLHTRTEYEGTGIGLSVCQKIIRRHGGEITAKSRPGEGSVFILTLPAA